ncbi:hypothetical protein LPJ66_011783, partial [Kickxella alabastrina]
MAISRRTSTASELSAATRRLQRKIRRFHLRPRTCARLEAMWAAHVQLRASGHWTPTDPERTAFLRAILRSGAGVEWSARAQSLVHADQSDPAMRLALLRVLAKLGDVHAFDSVARARPMPPSEDAVCARAILYARADLPSQAARVLQDTPHALPPSARPPPVRAQAMREILLAWTRARSPEHAWAMASELLARGYGRSAREWNALLQMHARDPRYRHGLLCQILDRMQAAGVAMDGEAYGTMLRGAVLRGDTAAWREWRGRMQRAGFAMDRATRAAVAAALARGGRWAEARAYAAPRPLARRALAAGPVCAHAFVQAATAHAALRAADAALLLRALGEGRVEESAAVDAVARRLPRVEALRCGRPLLGSGIVAGARALAGALGPERVADPAGLVVGNGRRKSFALTVNALARTLLREGHGAPANELLDAARAASIFVDHPHTLTARL